LQIPLLAGRPFNDQDTIRRHGLDRQRNYGATLWPGESPLGKRITIWRDEKFRANRWVVGDTKASLEAEAGQQMYVPFAQDSGWV